MKKVTFCLTSCNRWNLLQATLNSFLNLNKYPIERFILHEDSGNERICELIQEKYPFIEILKSNRSGLLASIDKLYALVDTSLVFHCEDDWYFSGNKNFMEESVKVLEERPDIHQVWIRKGIPKDWFVNVDYGYYKEIKPSHYGDWCGFSFNPGLRRLSDYKRMFPLGFNVYNKHGSNSVLSEHECNLVASEQGYKAVLLNNPACTHTGDGQSTYK